MNGVLILNKPKGMTSFSVVHTIHKLTKMKAGHAGTLDPMATGILVILLGKATKSAQLFEASQKEYVAEITFGITTDSLDSMGKVLTQKEVNITKEQLLKVMEDFKGEIQQIPPMVSALKKNGVRLYNLARQGITVEREPRNITIFELELLSFEGSKASIRVACSKGTYIRTLCDDIGAKLGCGAHMSALVRTKSGDYTLDDSISLEEAIKLHNLGELEAKVIELGSLRLNVAAS
jgi:tRNA pseudouridine55 synthase